VGYLQLGGFGVDYAQDPANPLLAPQPFGFGRTQSSYSIADVPLVAAWQVSDALSLGVALHAAHAVLSADPATFASPDCSSSVTCVSPRVAADGAWGRGAGVGATYKINASFSVGLAYTSPIEFSDFEWSSTVANPALPTFGASRTIGFQLDSPSVIGLGLAYHQGDRLLIAFDAKRIGYESADGFEDTFGFRDIDVYSLGVQWRASERFTVRAGYSAGDNPISPGRAFSTVQEPVIAEDTATVGFGVRCAEGLELAVAYRHGFENTITGPFVSVAGPVPGTEVSSESALRSLVFGLTFRR
jgi:long-chain fatty acid transport protein